MFDTEPQLIAAMQAIQSDPKLRTKLSKSARASFAAHWREDRVLAAYGAALARSAHARGDAELTAAFEAGAFENGAR